jgi:hypothetical protein
MLRLFATAAPQRDGLVGELEGRHGQHPCAGRIGDATDGDVLGLDSEDNAIDLKAAGGWCIEQREIVTGAFLHIENGVEPG